MRIGSFLIKSILGLSLIATVFYSCEKDEVIEREKPPVLDQETYAVNSFIEEYMNYFYLWNDKMPQDLNIKEEKSSTEYFYKLLYKGNNINYDPGIDANRDGDRWSFITDDTQGLIDYYNGVRESMGHYLYGYYADDSQTNLILVIAYVYKNSPAYFAELKRGDVIVEINGTKITANNVNDLLSESSYEITMGAIVDEQVVTTDIKKTLTKAEFDLDPILKSEVYNVNGSNVGYMVYNSFNHNSDLDLIARMEEFKAAGVDEFVLDLRYNPGGSVASAINLASMLVPEANIGDVFIKRQYNSVAQNDILNDSSLGEEFLTDKFTNVAEGTQGDGISGTPLPNLNLSRIYIITLENTASSSELIINGLKPYMDVVLIGEKSYGKYVASSMFVHKTYSNWAIQPIIFKSANSLGVTDYWDGFEPDLAIGDYPELGDFGLDLQNQTGEAMLATAIYDISGYSAKKSMDHRKFKQIKVERINPLERTMLYDLDK